MKIETTTPLISIITVVYNGQKYLEETIKSVTSQTYENIEYIIIDGGSTDGTLDIIRKYEEKITYWVSERDRGIYDAMNKGVTVSNGDWINFMNAGDRFYSADTVSNIFAKERINCDIIYGDLALDYGAFSRYQKALRIKHIWKGMIFSHQSCFISGNLHRKKSYSLEYSIGADFDFFYSSYLLGANFEYIPVAISVMSTNGLSDTNRIETITQWHKIVYAHDGLVINMKSVHYLYLFFDQIFRLFAKKILPTFMIKAIQQRK